jgi:hypothetical protein
VRQQNAEQREGERPAVEEVAQRSAPGVEVFNLRRAIVVVGTLHLAADVERAEHRQKKEHQRQHDAALEWRRQRQRGLFDRIRAVAHRKKEAARTPQDSSYRKGEG